jgi:hypothetical protein
MKVTVILWMVLCLASIANAAESRYSSMVMDVKGAVTAGHRGKTKSVDLGFMLYPGDEVKVAKNSSVTIDYLESGREEQWNAGTKFTVGKTASDPEASRTRQKGKIALPGMEFRQLGTLKLRYAATAEISVRGLSNTKIADPTPVFRWEPVDGAQSYTVSLYSAGKKLLWEKSTRAPELGYPEAEAPLQYGTRYEWEITALRDGESVAEKVSCFSLLTKLEHDEILRQQQIFKSSPPDGPGYGKRQLSLILFLKQHLLYDEAYEQYLALEKASGKSSSITEAEERISKIRNDGDCLLSTDN